MPRAVTGMREKSSFHTAPKMAYFCSRTHSVYSMQSTQQSTCIVFWGKLPTPSLMPVPQSRQDV